MAVEYEELAGRGRHARCHAGRRRWCTTRPPDNLCYDWEIGDKAATDAAFARAAHVTKIDLINNRLMPQRDGAARGDRRVRTRPRATTRSTRRARTRTSSGC